jgi:hypothetical protein
MIMNKINDLKEDKSFSQFLSIMVIEPESAPVARNGAAAFYTWIAAMDTINASLPATIASTAQ